ncbi:MAG: hypothetical protein H8E83_02560 [Planctomycetes bacterium]|nr:hypothetical protein [Planctomycetota bacterium]
MQIPTSLQANAAVSYSTLQFRRIIANWASDLLAAQRDQRQKALFSMQFDEVKTAA